MEGVEDVCWWVVMLAGEAGGASRAGSGDQARPPAPASLSPPPLPLSPLPSPRTPLPPSPHALHPPLCSNVARTSSSPRACVMVGVRVMGRERWEGRGGGGGRGFTSSSWGGS